jgi:hypothetical protein
MVGATARGKRTEPLYCASRRTDDAQSDADMNFVIRGDKSAGRNTDFATQAKESPMSVTEPQQRRRSTTNGTSNDYRERVLRETRPSFKTTEFWAMLAGIIVVAVVYNASHDPSLDLFRASLLATILAVAYIASRGLAKSGVRDTRVSDDDRY